LNSFVFCTNFVANHHDQSPVASVTCHLLFRFCCWGDEQQASNLQQHVCVHLNECPWMCRDLCWPELAPESLILSHHGCDCCCCCCTSDGVRSCIRSHSGCLLPMRQLRQQALLRRQVLRHQQLQRLVFPHVACFCSRCIFAVGPLFAEARTAYLTLLVRFEYPPAPDSAFGQKILGFSCPDGDPGCQKTPYVLRMTFASSLFFCLM
jgi:hypothetical protein